MNAENIATASLIITTQKDSKKGKQELTLTFSAHSSSIIMQTFNLVKNEFLAKTPSYDAAWRTKKSFESLQNCSNALTILSKPACAISDDQFKLALNQFETHLKDTCKSNSTRFFCSQTIRLHLANANLMLQTGRTTKEELKEFKSQFKEARTTIKSFHVLGDIASIEHVDIKDLESQAEKKIRSTLDIIEQTCKIIIDDYTKVIYEHRELRECILRPDIEEYYTYRLNGSNPWSIQYFKQPDGGTEQTLLAFIIQTTLYKTFGFNTRLPGIRMLPTLLKDKTIWKSSGSYSSFFFAEFFLPNHVLIAIAILICQKTGWNPSSVNILSNGDIKKISSQKYSLQSVKNKTDDKTPIYEFNKSSEPLLYKAIELILWHHKQVDEIFKLNKSRFFLGTYNAKFDIFFPLQKHNILSNFIIPYELKDFSAKDLRTSRAGLTMLTTKDIQVVLELLGHVSISTTEEYLRDTLFFQLNEARILEFQRRIETTIIFIGGADELVALRKLKNRHIDNNLFSAEQVGDGTRCSNPYDSPDPSTPIGKLCEGIHCHIDGGCKNNVIQVDLDDIDLALKTKKYYQSRWSFLYEKNAKAFSLIHIPKIIFVHVFLAHIKKNRPDLLPY